MSYSKYEHYKSSPFGDIPSHWEIRRLKELLSHMIGGVWGQDKQEDENDIICLRVADFNYNQLTYNTDNFTIRNIAPKEQKGRLLKQGDILLEKSGGGEKTPVGRAIVFDGKYKAVCSNFISKLTPKPDTNTKFLAFIMQTVYKTGIIQQYINQTTGIQNLQMSRYLTVNIPVPPLTEQIAIAAYLDHKLADIDTFIAKKQRLITLLQEQKTAMINKAVTKGLNEYEMRPSGIAWLGDIPTHWEVRKLKYVAETLRGKFTPRPRHDPRYYDGNYPFIQTGNISAANKYIETYNQTLNELGKEVSKEFPPNTVVMSIAANIADVAILTFNACFPDSIVGFKPFNVVEVDFLYYQLKNLRSEFYRIATKNTQYNLNVERVQNVKFVLPPLAEQIAIVSHIEAESARIDKAISLIERELTLVQEYRTALIAEAVTGKIKCPDVEQGQSIPS